MNPFLVRLAAAAAGIAFLAAVGCGRPEPPEGAAGVALTPVQVSNPVVTEVTEYDIFSGRLGAVEMVELRARVSGYLDEVLFDAGTEVEAGERLFIIDQRPYQNAVDRAEAELERAQTGLALAESEMERAKQLESGNAIATQEVERRVAEVRQARASIDIARAALEAAQLDLEFTEITAPIGGRISQEAITEGNLIEGGTTGGQVLATIVSTDPIYVYVDADERSVIEYREAIARGERTDIVDGKTIPFELGLVGQDGFPYSGEFDYIENRLNPSTGTLRVRGVVENAGGFLSPGMFARVRVVDGKPYEGLLVHEQAILTDQGNPFVYVLGEDDTIEFRPVETGPVQDGLRVVRSGLAPDDRVVVAGVMRLRPGLPAAPTETPMPRPGGGTPAPAAAEEEAPAAAPPAGPGADSDNA